MTDIPQFETQPPSRLPAPYVVAWGLLASLALGYLVLLVVRPDIAAHFNLRPVDGAPENNFSQRSMSKALADLSAAKAAIGRLEVEARELKMQLSAQEQRSHTLEVRIGSVETALKGGAANIALPVTPASARGETGPLAAGSLSGQTVQGSIEERPTRTLREGREGQSATPPQNATAAPAPAVTTAAMIAAPATKPAPAEAAGPPVGLLIASGPSIDAVRLSWQLLLERNRSALKSLEPRFTESGSDPAVYRLIAGPIANREEAGRVCDRLKTKQVRCSVTSFGGQPL